MAREHGPVHTGTISYRSTSVRSRKWHGEGLRSHGYGEKNQSVSSKTGPEIGRYGKVNQKLERYDIVPFCSRVNRSSLGPLSGPVWFLTGDTKLVSMTTSNVEVEIGPNWTSLILSIVSSF